MARGYWTSHPDTIDLDGERLVFDTHGTPMDMEWSLTTAELCDPERGQSGRSFIRNGFGIEVLREILALIGGPPPESFPPEPPRPPPGPNPFRKRRRAKAAAVARTPPSPPPPPAPAPIPAAIEGPVHLAIALFSDVILAAGLPMPPMAAPTLVSESVVLDGAPCEIARWSMAGSAQGLEAGVEAETAWWSPGNPARSSITAKILDRRDGLRALFVSAEAPFDVWEVRTIGEALIAREWLQAWLGKRDRRLV